MTGVDTAPNLRSAVVYVDVLDAERREGALAALRWRRPASPACHRSQVRIKYTPALEFAIDPGISGGERIDEILRGAARRGRGMTVGSENIERAARVPSAGRSHLVLACHVGPDGDALGSMLGLAIAATAAGKEVVASFGSPFLPAAEHELSSRWTRCVPPDEVPETPEVMVVLDVGSADRLGELAGNAACRRDGGGHRPPRHQRGVRRHRRGRSRCGRNR